MSSFIILLHCSLYTIQYITAFLW